MNSLMETAHSPKSDKEHGRAEVDIP